jgi:uncharacterized protein
MKQYISWNEYINMYNQITQQLKGTNITDVVGISRGGLIIAQFVAYQHNIGRVHNFGIQTYSKKDERLSDSDITFYQQPTMSFNNSHSILITDDIADSGRTLKIVMDYLLKMSPDTVLYTATLHYKPNTSMIKPTYFAQSIQNDDTWIVYPYDIVKECSKIS